MLRSHPIPSWTDLFPQKRLFVWHDRVKAGFHPWVRQWPVTSSTRHLLLCYTLFCMMLCFALGMMLIRPTQRVQAQSQRIADTTDFSTTIKAQQDRHPAAQKSATLTDTLILYTSADDPNAATIDQLWGLRAMPEVVPFAQPEFHDTYGQFAYSESFALALFSMRPQPSPNGRYLLIPGAEPRTDFSQPGNSYLLLVDLWAGTERKLLPQGELITWSPDSQQFAYANNHELIVQDVTGEFEARVLFYHEELIGRYIHWSPDGRWIAVDSFHQGKPESPGAYPPTYETIWLVSPDGDQVREFATVPGLAMEHVPQELDWSADSQYLVFQGHIFGLDGSHLELEDVGIVNSWLPKDPLLLVSGGSGLRLVDPAGATVVEIADQSVHTFDRAISHSGQQIAYTQRGNKNRLQLYIYDLLTGENTLVDTRPGNISDFSYLQWSADDTMLLFDDYATDSPVWAIPAQADSAAVEIIENGLLIEAIPLIPLPLDTEPAHTTIVPNEPLSYDSLPLDQTVYDLSTQMLRSPDGEWQAEAVVALPGINSGNGYTYYQQLTIARTDGSQQYMPLRVWTPYGLGYDYPMLTRWSADSQSLYFTIRTAVDGCGIFGSGSNLQRFDVTENTVSRILFGEQWATFAPGGEQVAYFANGGLVIRTLATYEEAYTAQILSTEAIGGHLIWSPNGSQLAYTIANRPCINGWAESTTLVVVDTETMEQTMILHNDKRRLIAVAWLDSSHLLVTDHSSVSEENRRCLTLALETGETATATSASAIKACKPTG